MRSPSPAPGARSAPSDTAPARVRRGSPALLVGTLLLGSIPAAALAATPPDASESATPNRLIGESSPYLRLHADNPVDWYPWGEEAFALARRLGRPIFLSVGYSTCYWCHVMEREVFSDPEIARLMNERFVNVKVDREERPDVDEIYMTATQLLTRRGGWPNSVFLTPELEPFYAGTYFPPEDRGGLPGFPRVLRSLDEAWSSRRAEVEQRAGQVATAVKAVLTGADAAPADPPGRAVATVAVERLKGRFDERWGGFGEGPKFPSPTTLRLLWEAGERGDAEAARQVVETLRRMGRGAIYDQLDGGFHRYTLDAAWRIPHFEKMLYDNAQLGELLAEVSAATGDRELERLARGTLDFVLALFADPSGGFKSAIDAETDGVEGAYYLWTEVELERVLGEEGFALLAPIYGFDGPANFEGDRYTLYLTDSLAAHAARGGLGVGELQATLEPHLEALRRHRASRPLPRVDDKVLADWNGLAISALARAGELLSEDRWVAAAADAARFVLGRTDPEGVQLHVWRGGRASIRAFLDDYAFLTEGLLALERATGERRWLAEAARLADQMHDRLAAPGGGYYQVGDGDDLLLRPNTATDGATPAGNGVAILAELELARRTGAERFGRRARTGLASRAGELAERPSALATVARAALRRTDSDPGAPSGQAATAGEAVFGPVAAARRAREVVRARVEAAGAPPGGSDAAQWRRFDVVLELADGWHVNANPASDDFLVATRIEGEVRRIVYPPAERLRLAFAEAPVAVWSGTARIAGEAAVEARQIELVYQACDDRRCLPPVTERLPLP